MITETRRIRLPRGPAVLRFEGVAEGIVPVSAIVDGVPGGATTNKVLGERVRLAAGVSGRVLVSQKQDGFNEAVIMVTNAN